MISESIEGSAPFVITSESRVGSTSTADVLGLAAADLAAGFVIGSFLAPADLGGVGFVGEVPVFGGTLLGGPAADGLVPAAPGAGTLVLETVGAALGAGAPAAGRADGLGVGLVAPVLGAVRSEGALAPLVRGSRGLEGPVGLLIGGTLEVAGAAVLVGLAVGLDVVAGLDVLVNLDVAVAGRDPAVDGLDEAVTGLDEAVAGLDEAVAGLDVAGLDGAVVGLEAVVGLDEAVVGLDVAVAGLDDVVVVFAVVVVGLALDGLAAVVVLAAVAGGLGLVLAAAGALVVVLPAAGAGFAVAVLDAAVDGLVEGFAAAPGFATPGLEAPGEGLVGLGRFAAPAGALDAGALEAVGPFAVVLFPSLEGFSLTAATGAVSSGCLDFKEGDIVLVGVAGITLTSGTLMVSRLEPASMSGVLIALKLTSGMLMALRLTSGALMMLKLAAGMQAMSN